MFPIAPMTGSALLGQTMQQPDKFDMRPVAAIGELIDGVDLGQPCQHADARAPRRLCRRGAAREKDFIKLATPSRSLSSVADVDQEQDIDPHLDRDKMRPAELPNIMADPGA
jgi:hypothetical protein